MPNRSNWKNGNNKGQINQEATAPLFCDAGGCRDLWRRYDSRNDYKGIHDRGHHRIRSGYVLCVANDVHLALSVLRGESRICTDLADDLESIHIGADPILPVLRNQPRRRDKAVKIRTTACTRLAISLDGSLRSINFSGASW